MSKKQNTIKKLGQISMKALGYSAKELRKLVDEKDGEATYIARIGGVAVEMFSGESAKGEWHGFKGQFVAQNAKGETYQSSVIFFPSALTHMLKKQFEAGVCEVEIKADVFVGENDKSASGYGYICEPVMEAKQKARVEEIALSLFNDTPALEDNSKVA